MDIYSIPYVQHSDKTLKKAADTPIKKVECPKVQCQKDNGFSGISISNQCDGLLTNINTYLNKTLQNQRRLESQFWCMKPTVVTSQNSLVILTAEDVLGGHIKIISNASDKIQTPLASELCKKAEKMSCKKMVPGDTFEVHIVLGDISGVSLVLTPEGPRGSWSPFNSLDVSLGSLISPNETINYWFRFTNCTPDEEAYEIIRPDITTIPIP